MMTEDLSGGMTKEAHCAEMTGPSDVMMKEECVVMKTEVNCVVVEIAGATALHEMILTIGEVAQEMNHAG